ncbi:hypothetical protein BJ878DRAFT_150321 [Calycina marina]|uniref:Uncharacterized protein n=1 Tax=Calycina marina TaxID=1763456 RepID=A0A9P7ZBI8_9HELO|nr:hypothetical protein BJ878DRAFT_150321 [Calycina marina]
MLASQVIWGAGRHIPSELLQMALLLQCFCLNWPLQQCHRPECSLGYGPHSQELALAVLTVPCGPSLSHSDTSASISNHNQQGRITHLSSPPLSAGSIVISDMASLLHTNIYLSRPTVELLEHLHLPRYLALALVACQPTREPGEAKTVDVDGSWNLSSDSYLSRCCVSAGAPTNFPFTSLMKSQYLIPKHFLLFFFMYLVCWQPAVSTIAFSSPFPFQDLCKH